MAKGRKSAGPPPKPPTRHKKVLRDNIQGISKAALRRLAERAGVTKMSGLLYEELRGEIRTFLDSIIRNSICATEHSRRRRVSVGDVIMGLKHNGIAAYGYKN